MLTITSEGPMALVKITLNVRASQYPHRLRMDRDPICNDDLEKHSNLCIIYFSDFAVYMKTELGALDYRRFMDNWRNWKQFLEELTESSRVDRTRMPGGL